MERACIECKSIPEKDRYFDIDIGRICHDCFLLDSEPKVNNRVFVKKVCNVHRCSTYNMNMMGSHEMPWCDIVSVETVGIQYPKTKYDPALGGMNGNIGRHYYRDWEIYCQQKDKMIHAEKRWEQFRNQHGRKKRGRRIANIH